MNHKKKSLAVLVIATLFIIAGYILLYVSPSAPKGSCAELGGICKQSCSIGERNIGFCGEMACCIPLSSSVVSPKFAAAVKERDVSKCALLTENLKKQCELMVFDSISSDLALKYNDAGYCNDILDDGIRDSCIQAIAWNIGNKSLCYEINSESTYDKCLIFFAVRENNWQICANELARKFDTDVCLKQIAVASKSIRICELMSLEPEKADCMLRVEIAMNSQNNVDCSSVSKNDCAKTKGCSPVLVTDPLEGLDNVYSGCARNKRYFCETTGGKWVISGVGFDIEETCDCGSKAYYEGYGCFDCNNFQYAKPDCLRRIASSN